MNSKSNSSTKILFEASSLLTGTKSGVSYYAHQMLLQLIEQGYDITAYYFNFLGRKKFNIASSYPGVKFIEIRHVPSRITAPIERITGLQIPIDILFRNTYDIIISPNFISRPSIKKTRQMCVIHDMCFEDFPDYVSSKNANYLSTLVPKSIRRSSLVIAVSDFTASRVDYYFKHTPVCVIPAVANASLSGHATLTSFDRPVLEPKSYFLFVGTIEPRKNLLTLLNAFESFYASDKSMALVLAGGKGWKDEAIISKINDLQNKNLPIHLTGYVSDDELTWLYENAAVYVMPSFYEGFGMPIIEAMYKGLPIIASNIDVFTELAGNKISYFEVNDHKDLASKMHELKNEGKRSEGYYKKVLNRYSWQKNGVKLNSVIHNLLK